MIYDLGCGILKYANGTAANRPILISTVAKAPVKGISVAIPDITSQVRIKCPIDNLRELLQQGGLA